MLSSNQNAQRLTLNIQRSTKIVILSRAKDLSIEAKIIHGMCVVRDASVRSLTSFGTTGAVRRWALRLLLRKKKGLDQQIQSRPFEKLPRRCRLGGSPVPFS
jgi:hypothetical protein